MVPVLALLMAPVAALVVTLLPLGPALGTMTFPG
jgi:hypothetical protein